MLPRDKKGDLSRREKAIETVKMEKEGDHGNKTYTTFQLRRLSGKIQPC